MDQTEPDKNFFQIFVEFSAPLFSVILMIFGSSFYTTFISLFLDEQGYGRREIGYIQSSFFLGMFIGAFQMEKLIKRVGHIQALAVFGSLATSSTMLQALNQSFTSWMVLRFVSGLSMAALYIVIESWMLERSTVKTRGVVLSIYMICLYSAQSASQQILQVIDFNSFTPFLLSALFTSLSVIPVGLSTNSVVVPPIHEPMSFRSIINASPFGVTGCLFAGLILSTLYSFFPIFSESLGISSANLMTITIAGGVILQWPIGKLSDYFDRRKILLLVVFVTLILSMIAYQSATFTPKAVLTLFFFLGGFAFTLYPLSISQVCDHLDHSHITTATALLLIAYGLGSVIGPATSSILVEGMGINAIFLYFSIVLGSLAVLGVVTSIQRPIVPLDEQTDFQPMPAATPVAYEMDPRGDEEEENQ